MGMNYYGLIKGNLNALEVVELLRETYGGDHHAIRFTTIKDYYHICFIENGYNFRDKDAAPNNRMISLHVNGACACDYENITKEPMTYISLGHSGDCKEIIDSMVKKIGGYIQDDMDDLGWRELT